MAGVSVAALLRYVLGSIDANFWGVAGGLTLGIAAALLFMLGLGSLFGRTGLAVGAALAVLVGNPLSGLTSAPELLPAGWGALGQLAAAGRDRDTAAVDGVLLRRGRDHRHRGPRLLGRGRCAARRDRRAPRDGVRTHLT